MSWFDAAGLANIAKSALKEAQRTIDKALDIKDENVDSKLENDVSSVEKDNNSKKNEINQSNSVWGSFTGSFFDHSKETQESFQQDGSLDDTLDISSHFIHSKLVVDKNEDCDNLEDNIVKVNDGENEVLSSQKIDSPVDLVGCDAFDSALNLSPEIIVSISHDKQESDECDSNKVIFPDAITVAPSRNNEQLPFNEETVSAVSTQPQSYRDDIPAILECSNVIDIPLREDGINELEISTESDQTVKDFSDKEDGDNLQNLLAEAISDKDSMTGKDGVSSPFSSEKSDLVKIGSDHTSGDELETATSSDIEIISSPNGDSSSTQSRQSPAKIEFRKMRDKIILENIKKHSRELSGTSSSSDDTEIEKLTRKMCEMSEILEMREMKIVEISRKNVELEETNRQLQNNFESLSNKQTQVTEEYAQRMSILEKKFQQVIREKDNLRKQLEQNSNGVETEKDAMIKQLREEGEKLSKQQLQHSNIIKKLRSKEKENENSIKQFKETIEDLTAETERLKRTVSAKEEIERTQIEAVNQLTSKNKKLEHDFGKIQSELEDYQQKYETLKLSLEAARKELNDKNKITNQLNVKEQLLESLENEKKIALSQNEEVVNQLQYLRLKLYETEKEYTEKEQFFKKENADLLKRLEQSESKNEELSQTISEISKPLVRQLETLQTTYNSKIENFEKNEKKLVEKISELQFRLNTISNNERALKEENIELNTKLKSFEVEFNSIKNQKNLLEIQLDQINTEKKLEKQELQTKIDTLESEIAKRNYEIEKFQNMKEVEEIVPNPQRSTTSSPTLSVGGKSDSVVSSVWSQLENYETNQRCSTNMLEIQMLQTNLQQRDGELQQLQWELNRREQERNLINNELTLLMGKVDDLTKISKGYDEMKTKYDELKEQYDLLCQMYGEKVDEVEELKLDLLEAKEVYKSQLDELLRNENTS